MGGIGDQGREIRRWPTARRGRIYIHAAAVPGERPEGWQLVNEELHTLAQLRGGIVGAAELTRCLHYANVAAFVAGQAEHRNAPAWFEPPLRYGFKFERPEAMEFRKFPGWFRFFKVPPLEQPKHDCA